MGDVLGLVETMCDCCWESYYAGYITRSEIYQCIYYLDIFRNRRDTLRRIPRRVPDDPFGEGLLRFIYSNDQDRVDYLNLVVRSNSNARRRNRYIRSIVGQGAGTPEESVPARGCGRQVLGGPTILDY